MSTLTQITLRHQDYSDDKVYKYEVENEEQAQIDFSNHIQKFSYIYQMLNLTYTCVDLGFTNNGFNMKTIEIIKNIIYIFGGNFKDEGGN